MANRSVLVVSGNPRVADKAVSFLKEHGYDISLANSPADAEVFLKSKSIDLIISDIIFDGKEDLDFLGVLRSRSDAPILIMSAKDSIDFKIKGYKAGCDDYISANTELRELELKASSLIRRSLKSDNLLLEYPPLSLNIKTREVYLAGNPVRLTNKEFEILNLLMDNPNKTISITDVYSNVWGDTTPCDSHLVMVNISYIRKKFTRICPDIEFIKTEWGTGYSFANPPIQIDR